MSIQALREKRGTIAAALKELVAKPDWDAATDQDIYDKALIDLDAVDASIKRVNDANAKIADDGAMLTVAEAADRIAHNKGQGPSLYAKWLRGGDTALNQAEWAEVRNTMSTTTGSEGGFTVQSDVATSVLDALKAYGGMRDVATIIRTEKGSPLSFPTSDGTSEVGELIAENTTATAADIAFGTKSLPVYKFSSKIVAVPFELLQDSSVDVEAFVQGRMITRLGRITNTLFTTGTGTGQPNGIVTAAATGVTAANSTSQVTNITYASVIDLIHSVDPAYRAQGNARFMMNDASVKVLRKVLDGSNRPIFTAGWDNATGAAALSAPDTLAGYPISINQDFAVMAAGAKSIAFGDFSHYHIRDAMDISMFRFTDSAYTKLGQVGFLAWMRSGGNLVDVGGAVKLFVNAAT